MKTGVTACAAEIYAVKNFDRIGKIKAWMENFYLNSFPILNLSFLWRFTVGY